MRRLALLSVLAAVPAVLAAGCGGDRDALTIYSGRGENLVGPLLEQFADETGIAIDVRYGDSADLALLIGEEGDRSPADVFLSQSPGTVGYLAERGLLAELDPELRRRVDAVFESERGLWIGLTARRRVLVYNEEIVSEDELPDSVFDVVEPQYRGRVGVAPENASFQDFVSAMRQVEGDERTEEWLRRLADNDAPTYANNNAIVEAVGRGEIPMGLVNHYYNYRFLEEDPGLPSRNYVFPDGDLGSMLLASTVSELAASDRRDEAERFIEFLLSDAAQRFFTDETFEYPLARGARPASVLPALGSVELPYDIDRLGGELDETVRMIESSGLE
jgi:iron(III) transport system substrate-binding protein